MTATIQVPSATVTPGSTTALPPFGFTSTNGAPGTPLSPHLQAQRISENDRARQANQKIQEDFEKIHNNKLIIGANNASPDPQTVRALGERLASLGYLSKDQVTGMFTEAFRVALMKFQSEHYLDTQTGVVGEKDPSDNSKGLAVDGKLGPRTLAALLQRTGELQPNNEEFAKWFANFKVITKGWWDLSQVRNRGDLYRVADGDLYQNIRINPNSKFTADILQNSDHRNVSGACMRYAIDIVDKRAGGAGYFVGKIPDHYGPQVKLSGNIESLGEKLKGRPEKVFFLWIGREGASDRDPLSLYPNEEKHHWLVVEVADTGEFRLHDQYAQHMTLEDVAKIYGDRVLDSIFPVAFSS